MFVIALTHFNKHIYKPQSSILIPLNYNHLIFYHNACDSSNAPLSVTSKSQTPITTSPIFQSFIIIHKHIYKPQSSILIPLNYNHACDSLDTL